MSVRHSLVLAAALAAAFGAAAQESLNHPAPPPLKLPPFKPAQPAAGFELPPLPADVGREGPAESAQQVDTVHFRGNTVIATEALAAIARPYLGRRLGAADIEALRQAITRHYIDAGYVNSGAVVASRDPAAAALTFEIVEGRLSAVRLQGLGRLDEAYVVGRLVPDEQAPLNIDRLRERFQLLLGDPLFARAQARVVPDSTPGRAILDIEVERARPYQLSVFANNARTASVGENAIGVTGQVRNLTGWGDSLEATLQKGLKGDASDRQSVAWRVPVNSRGTEFSLQADDGVSSVVEEPANDLDIRSRLRSLEVGVSQALYENLQQRVAVGVVYNQRKNRSTLLGLPFSFVPGEVDGVTKIDGWRFWQEYSHRWEDRAIVLRSTFLRNDTNLQAVDGAPDKRNAIWLGQGHFAHRFAAGTQLAVKATLQHTGDRLSPLDRLSIGGAQTVRGFRENQLLRDRGQIFNVDLVHPLLSGDGGWPQVGAGLFHDRGSGRNQGEPTARLSSTGITLKANWKGLRLDVAYALSRQFPNGVARRSDTLQDRGLHFQLTYNVFD